MAPKRKSPAAPPASPRRTRSMAAGKRVEPPPAAAPAKGKKAAKTKAAAVAAEPKGRKRVKKEEAADAKEVTAEAAVDGEVADEGAGKRVVVEACTQCRHFKIRALKVKENLESAVPGISVTINPVKPRRGCLEIREEGGEVFISLLNMPRPFTAMKKLDMDEVIKDIVKKIT